MAGFIIRLVGYALLLGASLRIAQTAWMQHGLDGFAALQALHDDGLWTLSIAPFVLALLGVGRLRALAVFVAFFLAGAALTAPFALARLAGA